MTITMKVLVLNSTDIQHCVELNELRQCMSSALISSAHDQQQLIMRSVVNIDNQSALGFMPAIDTTNHLLGYKIISVFHGNAKLGINSHQGMVTLLDPKTG